MIHTLTYNLLVVYLIIIVGIDNHTYINPRIRERLRNGFVYPGDTKSHSWALQGVHLQRVMQTLGILQTANRQLSDNYQTTIRQLTDNYQTIRKKQQIHDSA